MSGASETGGPPRGDDPGSAVAPEPARVPEARQRWRLTLARTAAVSDRSQREVAEVWEAAILDAGLPVARTADARSRLRIAFGAPLPSGVATDADWLEVVLTERWPRWRVREAVDPRLPEGWSLVELEDVWLGGPPLAGRVAAADYRVELDGTAPDGPDAGSLTEGADRLLAAPTILRDRAKGDRTVTYDLRPLLLDVAVAAAGPPVVLRIRTRIHPELGTGRPEEVVAALGAVTGRPVVVARMTRQRLLLVDDLEAPTEPA